MSITITSLEAENVKRIKAVALTPAPTGLTLVGGNNNQGKNSALTVTAPTGKRSGPRVGRKERFK